MIQLQQAEITGFLRTLLILLLIYYGFKFFVRLFGPYLFKKAVDTMKKKTEEHFGQQQETTVKEGETIIDKKPKNNTSSNKDVGEYVDFEEIE